MLRVPWTSHRAWLAVILLVVFGVYARSLANEFAYDDRLYVMSPSDKGWPNELAREWQGPARYFTSYYGETATTVGRTYRPTAVMSFALVNTVFPPASEDATTGPVPQRVANVLVHLLATWLVAAVVGRLFTSPWPGVVAAAMFGLHALRSDQVISIVGRSEVLAFVFGAASLLCYLNALARRGAESLLWSVVGGLSLFLACGAKESATAWAVFVPLFAAVCRGANEPGTPRIRLLPLVVTVVVPLLAYLSLWYPVFSAREFLVEHVNNPLRLTDGATRFRTAVMVLGYGLSQGIAPFWLHIDYSFNSFHLVTRWLDARFLVATSVLVAGLLGGLLALRRAPALFLGTAMFHGFAFVTSNLLFLIDTIYGERLMYTPMTGLCLVAAWGTARLQRSSAGARRTALALFTMWLVANAATIVHRCGVWHDNRTLFFHEAATQPDSQRLQMAAGRQYRVEGEALDFAGPRGEECMREWERYLRRALAAHPDQNQPDPLSDLAYMHLKRRDRALKAKDLATAELEESAAESLIEKALKSPRFQPEDGGTLYYLRSRIHERRGERDLQLADLERARDAEPENPEAHMRLARLHASAGAAAETTSVLREVMRRYPGALGLRLQAINLADRVGDSVMFEELLREGERRTPADPHLLAFRGISLSRAGRHREAIDLVQRAMRQSRWPLPPQTWLAVATSLLALGDRAQALRILEQHRKDPVLAPDTRKEMDALHRRLSR